MDNLNKNRKTKTSLSRRQKQIIQILVQMDAKPITVAAIAEKLKVSSRTILRELPLIEKWMGENDFHFSRKTGVGLQIVESQTNLELINELLELENTSRVLGKEERRRRLLGELLFSMEPSKAFRFTSEYGISEGTLFGDLDYLEEWLEKHQVRLIRRQGVGIFIEGEEHAIRQAIVAAVFDLYDMNQVMGLLPIGQHQGDQGGLMDYPPLLCFLRGNNNRIASRALETIRKRLDVRFRDSALVGLYIRIALAIYRINCGRVLKSAPADLEKVKTLREYEVLDGIRQEVNTKQDLKINEYEIMVLADYLSSARIWADASFFSDPMLSINIRQAAASMVAIVENITGLSFKGDRLLMDDLVSHFSAMVSKSRKDTFLAYTQIAPIKMNYPEIFAAVETACDIVGDSISSKEIMAADVGFLTMHFAAAAERIQAEQQKVVIAVVCPLGIGASRMLAASLKRVLTNIEIRKTISAYEISAEELQEEGVDLIVSTTELKTSFPHVCVGKLLQTQDRLKLQNRVDEINRNRVAKKARKEQAFSARVSMKDIRRISLITTEIVQVIENFRILQLMSVKSYGQLQEQAAQLFSRNDLEKKVVLESFKKREAIGSTYIREMKITLLHCKTDAVKHSRFGYIRLEQPLQTEQGLITGSVVMIAPSHLDAECLEPISRLSALLVEEPAFLEALQSGDTTTGISMAEEALVKFYVNIIK